MGKRTVSPVICVFILIVIGSCATTEKLKNDDTEETILSSGTEFYSEINTLIEKPISIYHKYNDLIPSIIHDLKQCNFVMSDPTGEMSQFPLYVIDYAKNLETSGYEDADEVTVKNPQYWKAIFALTVEDITALLMRQLLLMRDGPLRRAKIVLLYCAYDQTKHGIETVK